MWRLIFCIHSHSLHSCTKDNFLKAALWSRIFIGYIRMGGCLTCYYIDLLDAIISSLIICIFSISRMFYVCAWHFLKSCYNYASMSHMQYIINYLYCIHISRQPLTRFLSSLIQCFFNFPVIIISCLTACQLQSQILLFSHFDVFVYLAIGIFWNFMCSLSSIPQHFTIDRVESFKEFSNEQNLCTQQFVMKFYIGDNEGQQSHSWKFGCCPLTSRTLPL